MPTLCAGLVLSTLLTACSTFAQPQGRHLSPWVVYQGEGTIDALRAHADAIKSISVCGGPPKAFVDQCHELGIEVYFLVGIGGHDGDQFSTPEKRTELVAGYLQRARDHGYDGIDMDYESLDRSCRDDYSALLREITQAFHADGRKVTMCVSYIMSTWRTSGEAPGPPGEIDGGWFDPAVVGQICDQVRVMCYDMISPSGGAVGPVSTKPWARDAMAFWATHTPIDRLVMGIPAYSRDFKLVYGRTADSLYGPVPQVPEGTDVRKIWMPYEQIHQYQYADADGVMHVFYASDEASTKAHLETAAELGISAISFWHFGAVTPESWDVVNAWLKGQ